ncbi:MAG TPA: class I SAM-dependent methyltransferase [Ramlibacter sp.]|jgi:O-antigen chain-terminating methyltransferase
MKQDESRAGHAVAEMLAKVRSGVRSFENPLGRSNGLRARVVDVPLVVLSEPKLTSSKTTYRIGDFAALNEEAMLRASYRIILGRDVDPAGLNNYLPRLLSGQTSTVGLLGSLRWSQEGRNRGVRVRNLLPAFIADRLLSVRVIGTLLAPFIFFFQLPSTVKALRTRFAVAGGRESELINSINGSLVGVRRALAQLDAITQNFEKEMGETRTLAQGTIDAGAGARLELMAAREMLSEQANTLAKLSAAIEQKLPANQVKELASKLTESNTDSLYVAFENRFRGSTDEISKRSRRYLPMLRGTDPVASGAPVLDIGCGRGEWLSLLKDNNMEALGIDLNVAMVQEARARGHQVEAGDAIAYLQRHKESSLGAVTAFHVVEHLPFPVLLALFDAARRVLKPGGVILFETPNPENLVVGACTFHYDPTHIKPLPPDVLRFLAEARGFAAARIIRRDEDCILDQPESGFTPNEVNDWFRQPPDYALYAQKSAA